MMTPDRYKKLQKQWKANEVIWSVVHYFIGILGAVAGFLTTLEVDQIPANYYDAMPIVSGACAALITFLSPSSKRKSYTEARDILRLARLKYESSSSSDIKILTSSVEKAQAVIRRR